MEGMGNGLRKRSSRDPAVSRPRRPRPDPPFRIARDLRPCAGAPRGIVGGCFGGLDHRRGVPSLGGLCGEGLGVRPPRGLGGLGSVLARMGGKGRGIPDQRIARGALRLGEPQRDVPNAQAPRAMRTRVFCLRVRGNLASGSQPHRDGSASRRGDEYPSSQWRDRDRVSDRPSCREEGQHSLPWRWPLDGPLWSPRPRRNTDDLARPSSRGGRFLLSSAERVDPPFPLVGWGGLEMRHGSRSGASRPRQSPGDPGNHVERREPSCFGHPDRLLGSTFLVVPRGAVEARRNSERASAPAGGGESGLPGAGPAARRLGTRLVLARGRCRLAMDGHRILRSKQLKYLPFPPLGQFAGIPKVGCGHGLVDRCFGGGGAAAETRNPKAGTASLRCRNLRSPVRGPVGVEVSLSVRSPAIGRPCAGGLGTRPLEESHWPAECPRGSPPGPSRFHRTGSPADPSFCRGLRHSCAWEDRGGFCSSGPLGGELRSPRRRDRPGRLSPADGSPRGDAVLSRVRPRG